MSKNMNITIFSLSRREGTSLLLLSAPAGVGYIDEVNLRRARLVLGLVTTFGGSVPSRYLPTPILSLAVPPWIGALSTVGSFGHR